jgi:hypothetical protein
LRNGAPVTPRIDKKEKQMSREQWMWMRASVALMAAAVAAMRFSSAADNTPAVPQPIAGQ